MCNRLCGSTNTLSWFTIQSNFKRNSFKYELTIEATGETNLSSLNINEVVSILGVIYSNDNQYCFPLGFDDKDNFKASAYYNRNTKALVMSVNNFTLQKAVVTIQYTKSSS